MASPTSRKQTVRWYRKFFLRQWRNKSVPYNVKYIFYAQWDKNHTTHFTAGGRGDPSPTMRMNPRKRDVEDFPQKHSRLASLGAVAILLVSSPHSCAFVFPRKRHTHSPPAR